MCTPPILPSAPLTLMSSLCSERAAGWQTGIPRLPPHYSYREPKTLWAALGWVGTWILALRTLEIPILKGSEENTKSHLCHWMNGETKAKRENRRYLWSHNKSRDEWALTHSFFFSFFYSFHRYLFSSLCVQCKDKIEDSCPHGTHQQANFKHEQAW